MLPLPVDVRLLIFFFFTILMGCFSKLPGAAEHGVGGECEEKRMAIEQVKTTETSLSYRDSTVLLK